MRSGPSRTPVPTTRLDILFTPIFSTLVGTGVLDGPHYKTPPPAAAGGGVAYCLYQIVDTFDQRMSAGMALAKLGTVIVTAHGALHVVARRFG